MGKMLVTELELDPGVDTLARWMAHYIAEQIVIAERAVGEEKRLAEERCFEMILKLWTHRSDLPIELRPFGNFEPIFSTLSRLNPENEMTFFFNDRRDNSSKGFIEEVQEWLDIAKEIDEAARVWIEFVIKQAAKHASDEKTYEWLEKSAMVEESDDISIIKFLLDENETSFYKEKIVTSIKRLEKFTELNSLILKTFNEELKNCN
ncbi:hypothetical protein LKM19_18710 [Bacillus cereus]|uniref:hypothetical protein n=1 Tax=Bacillus cereus TaxID=1396 RepID=UPI001D0E28FC|nr:hypothetical protein [Bacillus cereus]MCC2362757.1 hypothetical protein [Bacillus cereus]